MTLLNHIYYYYLYFCGRCPLLGLLFIFVTMYYMWPFCLLLRSCCCCCGLHLFVAALLLIAAAAPSAAGCTIAAPLQWLRLADSLLLLLQILGRKKVCSAGSGLELATAPLALADQQLTLL